MLKKNPQQLIIMRILVTGSEGFLGQVLCRLLSNDSHEVIGYDIANGKDILDSSQLRVAMTDCDVCIHLAAIADLYIAEHQPEMSRNVNINATKSLLEIAEELDIRVLFASTVCAYGNNDVAVSVEDSPLAPTEVYAESKVEAEQLFYDKLDRHAILRLATFYGPNMRTSLATSIFIEALKNDEQIRIHGTGLQTRCYTHVDDIASGIITVMDSQQNGIYNISSDQEMNVLDLIELISELMGKAANTVHVGDRFGQINKSKISSEKLQSLGWRPKYDLRSGLKTCI